jgi:hypothetical protein
MLPMFATSTAPTGLTDAQQMLLHRAAKAEQYVYLIYPAPVAAALADALQSYIEIGYRFDTGGRMAALVNSILATPLPDGSA